MACQAAPPTPPLLGDIPLNVRGPKKRSRRSTNAENVSSLVQFGIPVNLFVDPVFTKMGPSAHWPRFLFRLPCVAEANMQTRSRLFVAIRTATRRVSMATLDAILHRRSMFNSSAVSARACRHALPKRLTRLCVLALVQVVPWSPFQSALAQDRDVYR